MRFHAYIKLEVFLLPILTKLFFDEGSVVNSTALTVGQSYT